MLEGTLTSITLQGRVRALTNWKGKGLIHILISTSCFR